jgi:hypothetical protein
MFSGAHTLTYSEKENMYLAVVSIAFRNRLLPGEFPYPFWQSPQKWLDYQRATALLLYLDPKTGKVVTSLVSNAGAPVPGYPAPLQESPVIDGQWLWKDENGKTQPVVTLFDGLFSESNPYKGELDQSYRNFATSLRDAQCLSCHVPSNPHKMKKLVLLQSPAHAASEIERVLRDVRDHRMPLDDVTGLEAPLDPQAEKVFLQGGAEFNRVVSAARAWEAKTAQSANFSAALTSAKQGQKSSLSSGSRIFLHRRLAKKCNLATCPAGLLSNPLFRPLVSGPAVLLSAADGQHAKLDPRR